MVCPFCGLGCDDLVADVEDGRVRAGAGACPSAVRLFARDGVVSAGPRVRGETASFEESVAAAAELLAMSRAICFAGLGADIAGLGAVVDLACRFGGSLDHYGSAGLFAALQTSQRAGWMAATIAEVRNRCDLLVVIGPDPTASFGRLFERLVPREGMFLPSDIPRRVVFLGGEGGEAARAQLQGASLLDVPLPPERFADAVALLRAFVEGAAPPIPGLDATARDAVDELAGALKHARYAVLVWNPGLLGKDADLIGADAGALVDRLNLTTRAAVFPLGGRDNIVGAQQVALWRLGYPLRTAVRGGRSSHDPLLLGTDRALEDADLLVWVSAFRPEPPPAFGGRVIALAHPDTEFPDEPDIVLPVGTPGVDHAGQAFRMDGIVCLPLERLRPSDLPSVAAAGRAILAAAGSTLS